MILGVLVLYGGTVSSGLAPWASSELVLTGWTLGNGHALSPFLVLVVRVAALWGGLTAPIFGPHLFSALCMAGAAAGVYGITRRVVEGLTTEDPPSLARTLVGLVCGWIAAALFTVFDSSWSAGTHLDLAAPMSALVVLVLYLLVRGMYASVAPLRFAMAAWLFTGLAAGVFLPLMVLLLPVVAVTVYPTEGRARRLLLPVALGTTLLMIVAIRVVLPWYLEAFPADIGAVGPLSLLFLVLVALAGIAALVADQEGRRRGLPALLAGGAFFLIGLSVLLLVPLRSHQDVAWDHGNRGTTTSLATTLSSWEVAGLPDGSDRYGEVLRVSGEGEETPGISSVLSTIFLRHMLWNTVGRTGDRPGAPVAWSPEPQPVAEGQGAWTTDLRAFPNGYYGIPLLFAVLGSIIVVRRGRRGEGIMSVLAFVALGPGLLLTLRFPSLLPMEPDGLVTPVLALMAVWIGIGAAGVTLLFPPRVRTHSFVVVYPLLALGLPVFVGMQNWDDHRRAGNMMFEDRAYAVLQSCAPQAVLFSQGDNDTFPLLVLQTVHGIRPDVTIINLSLLGEPWYASRVLRRGWEGEGKESLLTLATLEELVRHPGRKDELLTAGAVPETLRVPVSRAQAVQYAKRAFGEGSSVTRGLRDGSTPVRDLIWLLPVPESLEEDSLAQVRRYRVDIRDVLMQRIVRACGWTRPIQFTLDVSEDAYRGLEKFCIQEGWTRRLSPIPVSLDCPLAPAATRPHLFSFASSFRTTPDPRQVRRSAMPDQWHVDPGTAALVRRVRNDYLLYAHCMIQAGDGAGGHRAILLQAQLFPQRFFPLDYRGLYDIAVLYYQAGYRERYARYAARVREACRVALARHPRQGREIDSPYHYLLELALLERDIPAALAVLDDLERVYPAARDIRRMRQEIQAGSLSVNRRNR